MAKELTEAEKNDIYAQLTAELRARRDGAPMTQEEWLSFARRAPRMPDNWSSADLIRELRGPLPGDEEGTSIDDRG